MKITAAFKFAACSRAAFLRGALALSAFLLCAAALLALSSQAAAQILATVYIENDPKFRTAEPCAALGGTLQIVGNGQICSGIDQSGTFCIVG